MIRQILDWSEVWAIAIPLFIFFVKRPKGIRPVLMYVIAGLILNLLVDVPWKFYYHARIMHDLYVYNNLFYNLHSIVRLLCFGWFFKTRNIPANKIFRYVLFISTAIVLIILFTFFESINSFGSKGFTVEGLILISLCILYFLKKLKSDEISTGFDASLYIVTGLSIYEAVCFPIFLFYETLSKETKTYAVDIWDVHNIAYIVFCLFIARAFYGSTRRTNN
jgi:hypothetical protein